MNLTFFNSRELAIIFWISILVTVVLVKKESRKATIHLIKAFFKIRIFGLQVVSWLYTLIVVFIGCNLKIWDWFMLKDTIVWSLVSTFALNMRYITNNNSYKLKSILLDSIKVIVLLEFIVNLSNYSFFIEVIIIFGLSFIVILKTVAESEPEHQIFANFINWILAILGLSLLLYSCKKLISGFFDINWNQTTLSFFMPIWLTFAYLPFLYLLGLFAKWEKNRIRKKLLEN